MIFHPALFVPKGSKPQDRTGGPLRWGQVSGTGLAQVSAAHRAGERTGSSEPCGASGAAGPGWAVVRAGAPRSFLIVKNEKWMSPTFA